ncbi:MAG: alpha-amylase [Anaerolineae bacterium]|nr:alpha-amylase [Anaerolineae bacterium]
MDFIFGTFATDELKIIHHRTARRGVQHDFALHPHDPVPDQPVTITVQIGVDLSADHVACYYTLDGSVPKGSRGTATNGQVLHLRQTATTWDVLAWGYVTRWQAELPPQPENTVVRYQIGAWPDSGAEVFADWPNVRQTAESAAAAFFRQESLPDTPLGDPAHATTFSYHVDRLTPPDWARKTPIYHVFVDRFYPGDGRDWLPAKKLEDFFGGTLWGVRDKLDYIEALGVGCIWLSPTWGSPTYHGYDVTDYRAVEPRLGGDDALHALVDAAHARGLRVLLDMACNHLSNQHPIFQDAQVDPNSMYWDWFTFDDSEIGYRTFFGVPTMPEINVHHPAARAWLLDNARYWLREFNIDGYRLDYANGPGPDFWSDFRVACRDEKPDCFCFGEIIDQPAAIRPYIGRLDGCLDFHVGEALRKTFGYGTWSEADLARFLERHEAYHAAAGDFIRPTFIDNHDMDRFLYIAKGNKNALRRVAEVQMQLPDPPIVYYGTEVGVSQRHGKEDGFGLEASREPMLWDDAQDRHLLTFYRDRIQAWRARHG